MDKWPLMQSDTKIYNIIQLPNHSKVITSPHGVQIMLALDNNLV